MNTRRRILFLAILTAWLGPALYFVVQQFDEERIISGYLAEINLQNLPVSRENAIKISKAVRQDFENDESRFTFIDMSDRPFLREPASELIKYREGLCDAGTRVIINLLAKQGYDATRVTLYNQNLESSHTLVSVVVDGREFLLDSIGSPPGVTRLTIEKDIRPDMFNVLHYSDDIQRRRAFAPVAIGEDEAAFFEEFWLYSYEAFPLTKLLTKLGIDVRVFNLERPPVVISLLAEKPYLVQAIVWFLAVGVVSLFLMLRLWRRR